TVIARREHDRVDDGHDAPFGHREGQAGERAHDARDNTGVGHIRAAVGHRCRAALPVDHEANTDAALQVGVVAQTVLVAEAEASEVLAHDALDHLGREAAAHGRRAHANLRGLRLVRAAEATVARAEAVAGAVARSSGVADRSDGTEADAFPFAASALAD